MEDNRIPYIVYEGLMKLMDKAPDEQTRNEIRRLMENM